MSNNPFETIEAKLDAVDKKLDRILAKGEDELSTPRAKYKTRPHTAEALNITLPTLTKYTKLGLIEGSRIGNRVLYSEDAIEAAVKSIPTLRRRS